MFFKFLIYNFTAFSTDRTYVTVKLMVRVVVCLSSVCLFVCNGCIVAKR